MKRGVSFISVYDAYSPYACRPKRGYPITVETPTRPRYKLADLMAEMSEGLPRVEGWDEMPPVGLENG